MRKFAVLVVGALIACLTVTGIAQADPIQSITAALVPVKRDKKKFKPAKIYVEILTGANSSDPTYPEQPPSATNTKVNFPANIKFDPNAVSKCKVPASALDNTTTEAAINACGSKSVVSVGSSVPTSAGHSLGTSAWVVVDQPGPGTILEVPVVLTAFNGKENGSLYLHSRPTTLPLTTVLTGQLKTGKKAPKGYGSQLDVTIPPLAAGGITRFTTTVQKADYVQARCKNKNEKWEAITTFTNYTSPTVSDTTNSTCQQKKKKKK